MTFSSTNCVAAGSQAISVPGHKLLEECQSLCTDQAGCQAIVMRDDLGDNCGLRQTVDVTTCQTVDKYGLWVRPGQRVGRTSAWFSLAGMHCSPGLGADYAVDGQDVLPGHLSIAQCEEACGRQVGCEAYVWHDTRDTVSPNCYLRRNVNLTACLRTKAFNLRFKPSQVKGGSSGVTNTTVLPVSPVLAPWHTVAATNCYQGMGGAALSEPFMDPVDDHLLLSDCQKRCSARDDCEAIVMHETQDGDRRNCWLRRAITVASCEKVPTWNLWLRPGREKPGADGWVSYSDVNCWPGNGADYAVNGQDVLSGTWRIDECQETCESTPGCGAIVWKATNCYLRKNVVLRQCRAEEDFEVRVRASSLIKIFAVGARRSSETQEGAAAPGVRSRLGPAMGSLVALLAAGGIYGASRRCAQRNASGLPWASAEGSESELELALSPQLVE